MRAPTAGATPTVRRNGIGSAIASATKRSVGLAVAVVGLALILLAGFRSRPTTGSYEPTSTFSLVDYCVSWTDSTDTTAACTPRQQVELGGFSWNEIEVTAGFVCLVCGMFVAARFWTT